MHVDDGAEHGAFEPHMTVEDPPRYPGDTPPPAYPGAVTAAATGEPPKYPGPPAGQAPAPLPPRTSSPPTLPAPRAHPPQVPSQSQHLPPAMVPPATPPVPLPPPPPQPLAHLGMRPEQDDLALGNGRKHLKARQRGADKGALLRILVTLPTALVSLFVVVAAFSVVNIGLAGLMGFVWLVSGALIFHRRSEAVIARRILRMREPGPEEARRLAEVWGEVTRRAGVRQETYELWIQERGELNATATACHIVGVTRHAMDQLPNSHLAAILAHELGRHVGGHSWAGTLADWYALPARKAGRLIAFCLIGLLRRGSPRALALVCGIALLLGVFIYTLAFTLQLWWLVVLVAVAPLLVAWLHRRAEFRADDYAAGLGFGDELAAILAWEHQTRGHHTIYAARLNHLHRPNR